MAVNPSHQPQAELFPGITPPADPLIGRAVTLDPCDKCGTTTALIEAGRGPHAAELRCRNCNKHRRWVSHASHTAIKKFVAELIGNFGNPAEIVFRSFLAAPTPQERVRISSTVKNFSVVRTNRQRSEAQSATVEPLPFDDPVDL